MENFKNYIEQKEKNDAIKTGYNVRDSFWKDFLLVLNNSKGLADLLGVPKHKVSSWSGRINHALKEYDNEKRESILNKKDRIIKTGI